MMVATEDTCLVSIHEDPRNSSFLLRDDPRNSWRANALPSGAGSDESAKSRTFLYYQGSKALTSVLSTVGMLDKDVRFILLDCLNKKVLPRALYRGILLKIVSAVDHCKMDVKEAQGILSDISTNLAKAERSELEDGKEAQGELEDGKEDQGILSENLAKAERFELEVSTMRA